MANREGVETPAAGIAPRAPHPGAAQTPPVGITYFGENSCQVTVTACEGEEIFQRGLHLPSLHPQILSNLWFIYLPNPEDCILRGVKHLSWKDQRYHSETPRTGTGLQSTYNLLASTPGGTIFFPQTEPCLVKLRLHRFPSNGNLELNIFLPPFFRRKEMNTHVALISARCGFGGPHSACLNPPGRALPSRQAASSPNPAPLLWPAGNTRPLVPSQPSGLGQEGLPHPVYTSSSPFPLPLSI